MIKKQNAHTIKSFFLRTFIVYALMLVSLSYIFFMIVYIRKENKIHELNIINETKSNAALIESTFVQQGELLIQSCMSPSLYNAGMLSKNISSPKLADMKMQLAVIEKEHRYISGAWLYLPNHDIVIDNLYNDRSDKESNFGKIIQYYEETPDNYVKTWINDRCITIFTFEDRLFFMRDFPAQGTACFGSLFFEINMAALKEDYLSENMFIFLNNSIIAELSGDPSSITFEPLLDSSASELADGNLVCVSSPDLGLKFIEKHVEPSYLTISQLLLPFIPFLIIAVLVTSMVFSEMLRRHIIPLMTLTKNVHSDFPEQTNNNYGSEIEFLTSSFANYSSTLKQNSELTFLSEERISEAFFIDLMDGRQFSQQYLQYAFKVLGSNIGLHGIYWVLALVRNNSIKSLNPNEIIEILANRLLEKLNINSYVQCIYDTYVLALIEVPGSDSIPTATFLRNEIFADTIMLFKDIDPKLKIGNGVLTPLLNDINKSFVSAIQCAKKIDDFTKSSKDVEAMTALLPDTSANQSTLFSENLLSLIRAEKLFQAKDHLSTHISKVISVNNKPLSIKQEYLKSLFYDLRSSVPFASKQTSVDQDHNLDPLFSDEIPDLKPFEKQITNAFCGILDLYADYYSKANKKNIKLVCDYIACNFKNSDISLPDVAEAIGLSPSYLSRVFKSSLGITFTEYLTYMRIEYAKKLLTSTDMSISDIRECAGFNSEQNFFRAFKSVTLTTPKKYRDTKSQRGTH